MKAHPGDELATSGHDVGDPRRIEEVRGADGGPPYRVEWEERGVTPSGAVLAAGLLDGFPDGLLLVDSSGRIALANRSARTMFGYFDDAPDGDLGLVGRAVDDFVPDEQRNVHSDHRRRFSHDPEPRPMGGELRLFARHRNGEMFPVEISLSPVVVDGQQFTAAAVRDVTERNEARARLLQYEDRERIADELHDLVIQRLFAAGLSLQSITNLIESPIVRDRVASVSDDLDETIRAVRAAISSIGTGHGAQSLESQLRSVVDERSRHLGFAPDLVISGSFDDVPDFVADQLVATLTESITNVARHANATDATIRITRSNGDIVLTVRDSGGGVVAVPKPLGGLSTLMWRAAELGGSCSVGAADPVGTELRWRVPT